MNSVEKLFVKLTPYILIILSNFYEACEVQEEYFVRSYRALNPSAIDASISFFR